MANLASSVALLSATLLWLSSELVADSYRCGRKIIQSGDSAADVLRVCGEPRHKDRGRETVRVGGAPQAVSVERWYYKKNSRSLERIIVIHLGKVVAIDVGAR